MTSEKANIIFFMTDQQRWDCIGKFNGIIKTPNIDKLAEDGITFSQAVCQYPACVPSRNSMMFGLYPSQLGVRSNKGGLFYEDKLPVKPLPELLKDAGYQTAGFGKTHWNHGVKNDKPGMRGFETRAIGQHKDSPLYEHGALMMSDDNPEGLKRYYHETEAYGGGGQSIDAYLGCTSKIKSEDHRDGWVAQRCMKFLESDDIDPDKPLFLYLSFLKPHAGFNVPKEFEDLYDIDEIPDVQLPPWSGGEEPQTHISAIKSYGKYRDAWSGLTPRQRKRTTLRYWANCSWLDNYFGEVLGRLKKLGRLDNSIIVFLSDHGEMLGERNYLFTKYNLYEGSVRVPLILSGTAVPESSRGLVDERPAELIDIVPTLANIAGAKHSPMLNGLDLLHGGERIGSFCEFHGKTDEGLQAAPAYMWRKKEWKLILYVEGELKGSSKRVDMAKGELYCLKDDPNEWENLYYKEDFAQIREQMKTELIMHLACAWAKGPFYYEESGYKKLGAESPVHEM